MLIFLPTNVFLSFLQNVLCIGTTKLLSFLVENQTAVSPPSPGLISGCGRGWGYYIPIFEITNSSEWVWK